MTYSNIAALSIRGMLYDTTAMQADWKQADPDLYNAMAPMAWEMASHDGKPHGLALYQGVFWNVYRTDQLAKAGVKVPETWEDVLNVAKTVKDKTGLWAFGINGSRDQTPEWDKQLFAQMGGEWKDGVMQIDSEAGHYWLNWYQRAVKMGVISPDSVAYTWSDLIRNFAQDKTAMAQISSNVYTKDVVPELTYGTQFDVKPKPITRPGGEAQARYISSGWPFLVSSQTKHPYEAGLLLRYLADDEQAKSVSIRYQPTTNTRVMTSPDYLKKNPWEAKLVDTWKKVELRPFHAAQSQMNGVIRDAMQEALANPDANVAEMAKKYQKALDDLAAQTEE